jgi:hypothetical protein
MADNSSILTLIQSLENNKQQLVQCVTNPYTINKLNENDENLKYTINKITKTAEYYNPCFTVDQYQKIKEINKDINKETKNYTPAEISYKIDLQVAEEMDIEEKIKQFFSFKYKVFMLLLFTKKERKNIHDRLYYIFKAEKSKDINKETKNYTPDIDYVKTNDDNYTLTLSTKINDSSREKPFNIFELLHIDKSRVIIDKNLTSITSIYYKGIKLDVSIITERHNRNFSEFVLWVQFDKYINVYQPIISDNNLNLPIDDIESVFVTCHIMLILNADTGDCYINNTSNELIDFIDLNVKLINLTNENISLATM